MRILIIGSGGREHALAWKLAQSQERGGVLPRPGIRGSRQVANLPAGGEDPRRFLAAAEEIGADLTVVGPEASAGGRSGR